MKRLIAAVSFAVLATPAFAVEIGKPFEQLDLDRALPDIELRRTAEESRPVFMWANDPYFIAPPA